jgi:hypothetical protein
MQVQLQRTLTGAIRRDKHSPRRVYRNLDLGMTVRRNLKNYDSGRGKLLVDRLYFFAAERKKRPWQIIIAVDQSGSMLDSGIRMIGLGALGYAARPEYNKPTARRLRKVGMDVLVCTPEKLAECMARIIRG